MLHSNIVGPGPFDLICVPVHATPHCRPRGKGVLYLDSSRGRGGEIRESSGQGIDGIHAFHFLKKKGEEKLKKVNECMTVAG